MSDHASLYTATIPVLRDYLLRIDGMLSLCIRPFIPALSLRNLPTALSAGQHVGAAQSFALRAVYPVMGQAVPELSTSDTDIDALLRRNEEVKALLATVTAEDMARAAVLTVEHRAGEADLSQTAADYVHLFAMPNFFFHLTMAYALLQKGGLPLGKEEFDGLHRYPSGFSFIDPDA